MTELQGDRIRNETFSLQEVAELVAPIVVPIVYQEIKERLEDRRERRADSGSAPEGGDSKP